MKKSVQTSQQRIRIILRPGDRLVVRCRDNNNNNHRGTRRFITLHPGDRLVARCRHNNNNNNH